MKNRTHRQEPSAAARPFAGVTVDRVWLACALGGAILLVAAAFLPLWTMKLRAPQYPAGLHLTAYGTRMEGDLKEINALNHYVGVRAIEPENVLELKLFPYAIGAIVALLVVAGVLKSWRRIPLRWIAVGFAWAVPAGFLIDIQWWLYRYGHDLQPGAPLRIPEFTPKVIGTTKVINFHSETMVTTGFWLMVTAAVLVTVGPWLIRFLVESWQNTGQPRVAVAVVALLAAVMVAGAPGAAVAQPLPARGIQEAIDAASPGDTVVVPAGIYQGPIVVDKSIVLAGEGWPVIDGGRTGDVVDVTADGVTIRGFVIQGSSRAVSTEPGGIRLRGNNATIENNRLHDVLYGVILIHSHGHVVRNNTINSIVENPTERRGHAVYMWNTSHNLIENNTITTAKDGIFLGFTSFTHVHNNHVSDVRYGIHYMYSDDNVFSKNTFVHNLAGAAVMYSHRIELTENVFAYNESAASGYGILLKDVDDLVMRRNLIHHNRLGIAMEGAPATPGAFVRLDENLIGYNQTAIEMTTTTDAVFVGNSFIGNLQQVESRGGDIGAKNAWSDGGRGNFWDLYRGYDARGDGIGDIAFRYEGVYEDLVERNEALRAFKFTFAHSALDLATRWFPVYRPEPRVVDEAPLMSPAITLPRSGNAGSQAAVLGIAGLSVLVPALAFWAARSSFQRRWNRCSA